MLKKILNEVSKFDLYFREAEEDEGGNVEVKVAPRANRGTDYSDETTRVNAAPRNNRGTDYTEDDDTSDNTEANTDDTENQPDDNTDNNADDNNADDNAEDYTDDEDNTDDTGNEADTDNDTGNEPDTGEAEDYTDDDNTNDNQQDNQENQSDDSSTPSADDRKKYNLYLRFLKLIDMIDSFNGKLKNIVKDDPVQNAVLSKVVDNLTELHDTMYEYMTVKFLTAKYVESLIYFETVLSVVKLNFELIRNNKINLKQ